MARDYEVAIVGGGPNGLTAAAYLARSGTDVIVLERRFERGGTMASDDYSTPFTYNQAQAALPLGTDNPVVAELGLAGHGVAFIELEAVAVEVITRTVNTSSAAAEPGSARPCRRCSPPSAGPAPRPFSGSRSRSGH